MQGWGRFFLHFKNTAAAAAVTAAAVGDNQRPSSSVVIAAIPAAVLFRLTSRPDLVTLIFLPNEVIKFWNNLLRGLMYISIIFVPK